MSIIVSSTPLSTTVPTGYTWFSYSLLVRGEYSEASPYPWPEPPPIPIIPDPPDPIPEPDPDTIVEGLTTISDPLIRRWITATGYNTRLAFDSTTDLGYNYNPRTFVYDTDSYLLQTDIAIEQTFLQNITITLGAVTITARRATSMFDFFYTHNPVWIQEYNIGKATVGNIDSVSTILFRNLENITTSANSTDGTFTLPSPYSSIHKDTPVWYVNRNSYKDTVPTIFNITKIPARSLVWTDTSVTATTTQTGTITYTYKSISRLNSLLSSGVVNVGLAQSSLALYTLENRLDSIAKPLGIERNYLESNRELSDRVYKATRIPRGSTIKSLPFLVALDLGLVELLEWDGSTTLDLVTSGYTNVIYVAISETDEIEYQGVEELHQVATSGLTGLYTSKKKSWESGYGLYLNGETITTEIYPSLTVTSTGILFNDTVEGRLLAEYSARNYTLTTSGNYITSVIPTSSNIEIKDRVVALVKDVTAWNPTSDYSIQNRLTTVDGMPNEELLRLVNNMKRSLPVMVGSTYWGTNEVWFADLDIKPKMENLPIILH